MNEQEEFFSPKHKWLLSIATWAKYSAWAVLIVFALDAISVFIQNQVAYANGFAQNSGFTQIFRNNPEFAVRMILDVLSIFLKGLVYYLVLRGVFLGLNMIVETDINYRGKRDREVHNERRSS